MGTSRPPLKYWRQRFDIFDEWEKGYFLDTEAWYSTTPYLIAKHQAEEHVKQRTQKGNSISLIILDACCGAGGNAIAFAKAGHNVIACDIDSDKLQMVSFCLIFC